LGLCDWRWVREKCGFANIKPPIDVGRIVWHTVTWHGMLAFRHYDKMPEINSKRRKDFLWLIVSHDHLAPFFETVMKLNSMTKVHGTGKLLTSGGWPGSKEKERK
jgi:hypothetical protein